MDASSIIAIVIGVVAIYFFIKLVVSPIIKAVLGIVIFLVVIYLLQRMGFNFDRVLAPLGISLNINSWGSGFNWILNPVGYLFSKIKEILDSAFQNIPKY